MKYISIDDAVKLASPQQFLLAQWVGSNDILTRTGDQCIIDCEFNSESTSLKDALRELVKDESGNSFDVIVFINGEYFQVDLFPNE